MDDDNSTTTRLLTLLNVSATRAGKRRRLYDDPAPAIKLNKRKSVRIADNIVVDSIPPPSRKATEPVVEIITPSEIQEIETKEADRKGEEKDDEPSSSSFQIHFGVDSPYLTEKTRDSADNNAWDVKREKKDRLGTIAEYLPEGHVAQNESETASIIEKLMTHFKKQQEKLPKDLKMLQDALLSEITTYQDFYLPRLTHESHSSVRDAVTLHALNHITKKRRRVLKNNERVVRAAKNSSETPPSEIQDQGFTRPSVLVILPFRSWALRWVESLTGHTPKPEYQVENHSRFIKEYGLPPDATDKLEAAPPGTYPPDHVEMFKGNVDDSFRLGVKLTRKTVKLFADFYQCDMIIASPLGLRMSIEKDGNADFLSSIEMLVVDQMDALSMQNWEHLQFVFSNLNELPKETRDADFSRIKPWYLDGHASYLRQTIMLSPYETPDFRHLFNSVLKNVGGKKRIEGPYSPVQVPEGVSQSFVSFECGNHKEEADKRFQYFSTKVLPTVLKSAVHSTNTLIFVPSSYDFIRVENHLRKTGVSFAVLSEYSSNQDISRARQAFFSGKKAFLLISERFHFFRRYKLRGVRNLLFYGLPDHVQYYAELLACPFLDEGVESSDVNCRALYCKYDWMRLERISGTEGALELVKQV
ncbi:digestive organ expansion factor [Phellopilus nigrolimitatus]|nr:digestive organ expansion factor [Phellopilus nigrolimitatus]